MTRAAVVTPRRHLLRDYFHEPVVVLRVANLDDVEAAKEGHELDAADREALRKRQYVVIYDGVRQRVCHSGFLRERKTVEELEASEAKRRRKKKVVEESES